MISNCVFFASVLEAVTWCELIDRIMLSSICFLFELDSLPICLLRGELVIEFGIALSDGILVSSSLGNHGEVEEQDEGSEQQKLAAQKMMSGLS